MHLRKIHVIGAGTMGAGIAHVALIKGMDVVLIDVSQSALDRAMAGIARDERLLRLTGRAALPDAIIPFERITTTLDIGQMRDARLVVECLPERMDVKRSVYALVDELCPQEAVLATVTSAIPIARMSGWTRRPDRIIGTHFMNPVQWKDAVEVVCGPETSLATRQVAGAFLDRLGKRALEAPDGPGFVINRVLMPAINDAARLLADRRCGASMIDRLFRDCLGHRCGPLETADLIGIDTTVDTLRVLRDCSQDERFEPCPTLVEMVDDGRLGKKSGRGFYEYQDI